MQRKGKIYDLGETKAAERRFTNEKSDRGKVYHEKQTDQKWKVDESI